jgi:hypothetical protein
MSLTGPLVLYLGTLKTGDEKKDRCLDDAIYFLDKAQEAIDAHRDNPEKWYQESVEHSKIIAKSFPFILMAHTLSSLK